MPGQTPNYRIPYPLPSDPIKAQVFADMATRVDNVIGILSGADPGEILASLLDPPAAQLVRTSGQSIPRNTDTFVSFNSTVYDSQPTGAAMAGSNGITIRVPGIYDIKGFAAWAHNASWTTSVAITRTRGGVSTVLVGTGDSGQPWIVGDSLSVDQKLLAGDLIRLRVFQNSGGNQTLSNGWLGGDAHPRLSVAYIRPSI